MTGDHDVLGAAILFALAVAAYVWVWVAVRRDRARQDEFDALDATVAFHAHTRAAQHIIEGGDRS